MAACHWSRKADTSKEDAEKLLIARNAALQGACHREVLDALVIDAVGSRNANSLPLESKSRTEKTDMTFRGEGQPIKLRLFL
jgi:hypothetical protein